MANTEKEAEPYWPSKRMDRQPAGKQPMVYKGFCALCGTYSRRNLARSDYFDPIKQFRTSGLLCADCFSEVTEALEGQDSGDEGEPSAA